MMQVVVNVVQFNRGFGTTSPLDIIMETQTSFFPPKHIQSRIIILHKLLCFTRNLGLNKKRKQISNVEVLHLSRDNSWIGVGFVAMVEMYISSLE